MARLPEPCLCGAPDCARCFPGSYASDRDYNWAESYFEGPRCSSCPHYSVATEDVAAECSVIEGDGSPEDCPALQHAETKLEEEYESDRYEARQRARRGE